MVYQRKNWDHDLAFEPLDKGFMATWQGKSGQMHKSHADAARSLFDTYPNVTECVVKTVSLHPSDIWMYDPQPGVHVTRKQVLS